MRRRRRTAMGGDRGWQTWAIPAIYSVLAVIVGITLPRLESRFFPHLSAGVDPAAAMAILSSVASGMISLTGIVFGLAFVMVQFSSTAYSPRLVLWIVRSPLLWHAIGVFSATFLYSLAAIAWVHRPDLAATPLVSTWLVIALLLVSVGVFIALIQMLSLLQIQRMLEFTARYGRRVIDEIYPPLDAPATATVAAPGAHAHLPLAQTITHRDRPRTVQALDVDALVALAAASGAVIVVAAPVGDTLVEGSPLARVYGTGATIDEARLRDAFAVGDERTFEQDPKYALRLIVDIAIRALSPAVNDPTTAVQALDHVEDLLRRLGTRRLETGAHRDAAGVLRLVVPHPSWEDFLALAFDEIRHCGASSVQVMRRMHALVADLEAFVPGARRAAVERHRDRLVATIAAAFPDEVEQREAQVADRQGIGAPRDALPR